MLWKYIKKYKWQMAVSMFLIAITVIGTLLQPKILEIIINDGILNVDNNGISNPNTDIIYYWGTILIVIGLITLLAGVINVYFSVKIAQSVGRDIREDAFAKVQELSYADVEHFEPSKLVVRLTNDVTQIQNVVAMAFQSLIRVPLLFIGAFFLAYRTIPELWWIIVVEVILVVVIMAFVSNITIPVFRRMQGQIDSINTKVKENFEGIRVVKSFVQERQERKKFLGKSDDLKGSTIKAGLNMSIVVPLFMFVGNMTMVVAIWFCKDLAIANPDVIGQVVSYTNYLMQIMMALIIAGMLLMMASRAMVSVQRLEEIIEFNPSMKYNEDGVTEIKGDIEFKNVSFKYSTTHSTKSLSPKQLAKKQKMEARQAKIAKQKGEKAAFDGMFHDKIENSENLEILKDISFTVKAGETVGIVGTTGSGKSTLVSLLARLYDASEGEILIDGINIKDIPKETIRSRMSVVFQKPIIFSGTIADNIRQGKANASIDDMQAAAQASQAAEFINKYDENFDAYSEQRGANFSGGQKQRISITRGLVSNPSILILDDSTSALDARSERLVKEALDSQFNDVTKVIVSQKISSVVNADKIIVLKDGIIDGIGTHKELLTFSDAYVEIFETQKGKSDNLLKPATQGGAQ